MEKKILLAAGLIFLLLPVTPAFAFEDTSRMDILESKVNDLGKKAKVSDSKMKTLETQISQLQGRLDTNDSKMKYMVRQDAQMESRVSDLEAALGEKKNSGGKINKNGPEETKDII